MRKAQQSEEVSSDAQSERGAAKDSEPEGVSTPFELEWEMDTDEDEEETLEECRRIFNEAHPTGPADVPLKEERPLVKTKRPSELEPAVPTKKRVAHNPELVKRPERPMGLAAHVSAAQAMHNRFAQLQQRYAHQGAAQRVAPVANAPLLAAARRSALAQLPLSQATPAGAHVVATQPKGQPRVAHVPALVLSKRPTIPAEYGSRVPTAVRQRYLNLFLDECAKGCSTEDEAIEKALSEEKQTYERSSGKSVYLNVAVNTLKRLRREAAGGITSSSSTSPPQPVTVAATAATTSAVAVTHPPAGNRVVSHEMLLHGARAARTSFSIEKNRYRKPAQELTASRFYELLEQYRLSTEQLVEYNYPRAHPTEPGRALFGGGTDSNRQYSKPHELTGLRCSRCGATFSLTEEGEYKREEECVHHWGRLWKKRIAGALESRYSCCQGDGESDGCCVGKGHVHEGPEPKELTGFVSTLDKSSPPGGPGVYALDCEMCYTSEGVELTRVTVVGWDRQPVYEALVKPRGRILDYNTRFSGLTEEDLAGVRTSLREVQASLLSLFSSRTLLVGHSLDSDLRALRLVHDYVVDTAAVFPHRRGLPYKRALRTLMAEFLNKIIQDGVDGHDSQEDAAACMELMLWRVREDLKKGVR